MAPYGRISDIPTLTVSAVTFDSEISVQKVIPFWKSEILGYKIGVIKKGVFMDPLDPPYTLNIGVANLWISLSLCLSLL